MPHDHGPHGHEHQDFDPERLLAQEERRRLIMPPEEVLAPLGEDLATLADVGCGAGFLALPLARLHPRARVLAVDRRRDSLDLVASRAAKAGLANIETVLADATCLPFADESVDAVLMASVFHDIPDRAAARDEVRRVLRPGGTFLLIEWDRLDAGWGPPIELRIGPEELAGVLAEGGFAVTELRQFGGPIYRLTARRA